MGVGGGMAGGGEFGVGWGGLDLKYTVAIKSPVMGVVASPDPAVPLNERTKSSDGRH